MRKATIIVIAAIYVASIVIVGVFGLRALNFEQTIFIKDIVMPETVGGQPVTTTDGKSYVVELKYKSDLEVLLDYDKEPRDAQGDIEVKITEQISYSADANATVATLEQTNSGLRLKIYGEGFIVVRFEAIDGSKVSKELCVLVTRQSN